MNILFEICKKHKGAYYEDDKEIALNETPRASVKTLKGKIKYKEEYFLITLSFFSGPFTINLISRDKEIPEFKIHRVTKMDQLFAKAKAFFSKAQLKPRLISKQFDFEGDQELHDQLSKNDQFLTEIKDEFILIEGSNVSNAIIRLKPFNGIYTLAQFEKYFDLLILIKQRI